MADKNKPVKNELAVFLPDFCDVLRSFNEVAQYCERITLSS